MAETSPPIKPKPFYWFILERSDQDGGKPYLDEWDLERWGGVPIPIYDERACLPAYEDPTTTYNQDARVTLRCQDIAKAVIAAGRIVEFPPVLASITLPQRLGRLWFNYMGLEELGDYKDQTQQVIAEGAT